MTREKPEIRGIERGQPRSGHYRGGGNHRIDPQPAGAFDGVEKTCGGAGLSFLKSDNAMRQKSAHARDLGFGDWTAQEFIPSGGRRAERLAGFGPREQVRRFRSSLADPADEVIRIETDHRPLQCFRSS